MSLLNLPPEILLMIADHCESQHDINSFVKVNRHLWGVMNLHLHRYNIVRHEGKGLNCAAVKDLPNSARNFIQAGIRDKVSHWDRMPLILASQLGNVPVLSTLLKAVISLLLGHGADAEATINESMRPLDCAFQSQHIDAFQLLITQGAKVQTSDIPRLISKWEFLAAVMATDTESTINVNYRKNGKPILHIAASGGYRDSAKILIGRGANIEAEDHKGMTALQVSVSRGQKNMVDLFLELGADFTKTDHKGNTPLHYAANNHRICWQSREAIATALLEKGADIEARNKYLETPLWHAVRKRSEPITKLLIEKGADIEPRNRRGETPFICAVRKKSHSVAQLLIEKGCDTQVANNKGRTALDIAKSQVNRPMFRLVSANVNARSSKRK
ncbi:uncharacterized protein N7477_002756 [Penicillium maclennaniae]|uniref:uncharacterized protein n=1 Tax=Penicillium maclennaniae TaxID=1343394 RepID=UPI002541A117|nr:uncharacterized protein N7477_002756 [Penicillium maclennaniae]KAJ5677123.1 hypothetical protein N7477_002756 [Penicillium maclennaniae]